MFYLCRQGIAVFSISITVFRKTGKYLSDRTQRKMPLFYNKGILLFYGSDYLFKVFHSILKDVVIICSRDVFHQSFGKTFRVAHSSEDFSVRAGYPFDSE